MFSIDSRETFFWEDDGNWWILSVFVFCTKRLSQTRILIVKTSGIVFLRFSIFLHLNWQYSRIRYYANKWLFKTNPVLINNLFDIISEMEDTILVKNE